MRYQSFSKPTTSEVEGFGQKHIIRTQAIEINFDSGSEAFALQNKLSVLVHERLLRGMEELFDEFGRDHLFSFDLLNLDCGILSSKHWEEELVSETLRQLREQLLAANSKKNIGRSRNAKLQDVLLFYIKHAYLPWNHDIGTFNDLEEVELDKAFVDRMQMLIKGGSNVANRLVNTFSESFINEIIRRIAAENKMDLSTIIPSDHKHDTRNEKLKSKERILESVCYDETTRLPSIGAIGNENFEKENPSFEDEPIYISNAGLVILHPFLHQLFEKCGLIKDNEWVDPEMSQSTASTMLQFIVWGVDDVAELNSTLNKLLCGLRVRDAIVKQEGLPDNVKEECEILLTEVISHWKVLRKTGIEAFRETFFQRNGKLVRVNNGWLLQVEQKSFDVLLSSLPWGIGTIKLPWMNDILFVEWA